MFLYIRSTGAISVCRGQAVGDGPGEYGPHRNLMETSYCTPFRGSWKEPQIASVAIKLLFDYRIKFQI